MISKILTPSSTLAAKNLMYASYYSLPVLVLNRSIQITSLVAIQQLLSSDNLLTHSSLHECVLEINSNISQVVSIMQASRDQFTTGLENISARLDTLCLYEGGTVTAGLQISSETHVKCITDHVNLPT